MTMADEVVAQSVARRTLEAMTGKSESHVEVVVSEAVCIQLVDRGCCDGAIKRVYADSVAEALRIIGDREKVHGYDGYGYRGRR